MRLGFFRLWAGERSEVDYIGLVFPVNFTESLPHVEFPLIEGHDGAYRSVSHDSEAWKDVIRFEEFSGSLFETLLMKLLRRIEHLDPDIVTQYERPCDVALMGMDGWIFGGDSSRGVLSKIKIID